MTNNELKEKALERLDFLRDAYKVGFDSMQYTIIAGILDLFLAERSALLTEIAGEVEKRWDKIIERFNTEMSYGGNVENCLQLISEVFRDSVLQLINSYKNEDKD